MHRADFLYVLERGCFCGYDRNPVCGKDGKTYSNECDAECYGVDVVCKGECPCQAICACTQQYAPVCSYGQVTYGNSCEAKCDNAEIECDQKCPCPTSTSNLGKNVLAWLLRGLSCSCHSLQRRSMLWKDMSRLPQSQMHSGLLQRLQLLF